ncbi:uncharacterized protein LOC130672876 [Microplitis mediator]|uniref:uncharacterized protein LOC130672876 n=1 Tax=Microplitis mediator TaxID=375433 RepID=UPI00255525E0|nr:uncharacterized protein LOC130672876 [Microplitis mediator]
MAEAVEPEENRSSCCRSRAPWKIRFSVIFVLIVVKVIVLTTIRKNRVISYPEPKIYDYVGDIRKQDEQQQKLREIFLRNQQIEDLYTLKKWNIWNVQAHNFTMNKLQSRFSRPIYASPLKSDLNLQNHHTNYFSNVSTYEIIAISLIIVITYLCTGLMLWGSVKGKYIFFWPYLIFLCIGIISLSIFFVYKTVENFKSCIQSGFLILIVGLIVIGLGIYSWVVIYKRFKQLKTVEMDQLTI